jgi:glycosyltransferase involved in cell wall biosynthesis
MMDLNPTMQKFSDLKCCVIIPTFNNDRTLGKIIEGVLAYTREVIVVNDGSTDATSQILSGFPQIRVIHIDKNTGKGNALKNGFWLATELGFHYAISIDSDGQHFPEDLPKFLDAIEKDPDSIIIGARNMDQESIPGTSSFGHKFSIFWFRVETGMKIPDVQSGYRLYPLERMKEVHFYSRKFEFEAEVLVRLAWRNVKVIPVPVRVYYAPAGERVSHFRKVRDFARVSIVNTILVMMALLWVGHSCS